MKYALLSRITGVVTVTTRAAALLIMGTLASHTSMAADLSGSVAYQRVFPALGFKNPTFMLQQPGDDRRFYVLEKEGRIYYFDNRDDAGDKRLWLDISEAHVDSSYEGGLLGMAFDPDFGNNRYVYLSYTGSDDPWARLER